MSNICPDKNSLKTNDSFKKVRQEIFELVKENLTKERNFTKFGSNHKVFGISQRKIHFSKDLSSFEWIGRNNKKKSFLTSHIVNISEGKTTPNFLRYKIQKPSENLCFSLLMRDRSIDLKAKNISEKKFFCDSIKRILDLKKNSNK